MHEWALADGVIATALKAANEKNLSQLKTIDIAIGELQQIEIDVFEFALKEVMPVREPRLQGVEIRLHIAPARFTCRACGREFGFADAKSHLREEEAEAIHFLPEIAHTFLRCPQCQSPDFQATSGRGVWIDAVEGV